MLFRSLDNPKLKPAHTAFDIVANANEAISGVRGQPFIIEDIEAFIVLKEDITQDTAIIQLIADKKAMLINDGKGIRKP